MADSRADPAGVRRVFGRPVAACCRCPACKLLREEDGLAHAGRLIREALEPRLRETAYTLACEVVAADRVHGQPILQMLEFLGNELKLDTLVVAAIERGTRARYQRIDRNGS